MLLTLFTDASFCPTSHAAGWGAWAKRSEWSRGALFGGQFKTTLRGSSEAEFLGLVNAVYRLNSSGCLDQIDALMIQSDNLRALAIIANNIIRCAVNAHPTATSYTLPKKVSLSDLETKGVHLLDKIVSSLGVSVQLRHIKGHQDGPSRQWVNRECDRIARLHMRNMRLTRNQQRA